MDDERTNPKPLGIDPVADAPRLLEGRYGTKEMCDIWGTDANTYEAIMQAQLTSLDVINDMYPNKIPPAYIDALRKTANLNDVNPDRVRQLEAKTGHDVIAVNTAWGEAAEKITPGSSSVINYTRTSADSTETAKSVRCIRSLEVLADSGENLRDILLERSVEWIDDPHMDQTHLYDALPTVAGRPLSFYAEMLQSDLDFIDFVYMFSLMAKWADATGNHHSAVSEEMDGIKLQEAYARRFGLRNMTAPAQIPGREFNADIMYALARMSGTLANIGRYIRQGRGDDRGIFIFRARQGTKGSSAMPHKDLKGGNPTAEEQAESLLHEMTGKVATAISTIIFDYGRDLCGSASDRLDLGPSFKFSDHVTRRLADVVYRLELDRERSMERLGRTYGTIMSPVVMNYLVDPANDNPMPREVAHNLVGRLAREAYEKKVPLLQILESDPEISSRVPMETLLLLADPATYIGQSREIIRKNYSDLHGKKTFVFRT